jgi:hypothetical protein
MEFAATHVTATLPAKAKPFTASGLAVSGFDEGMEAIRPKMLTTRWACTML